MAIAFLTTQTDYEIKAITVSGTGLVHCLAGETNVRDLLNELNQPAVPVACGPDEPLDGGTPFPAAWRASSDDRYGVALAQVAGEPQGDAVATLIRVLRDSPEPVTLLTLGPQTNLASALRTDGRVAGQVARNVAMGGALDVPGNGTPEGGPAPAEWNFLADPVAAAEVIASGIPTTLIPLDATNDVPLTRDFVDRLAIREAGPANLAAELLAKNQYAVGVDYLWDQLAAVALLDPSVIELEEARVAVETQGPSMGRTVRGAAGTPVTVATGADRAAFEAHLIDGLHAGGSRKTPFELAGVLRGLFDGKTCAVDALADPHAGLYSVTFGNRSTVDTGFILARIAEGYAFQDLLDWIEANPAVDEQPPMVEILGFVVAGAGSDSRGIISIPAGTTLPACQAVDAGTDQIVLGEPIDVE